MKTMIITCCILGLIAALEIGYCVNRDCINHNNTASHIIKEGTDYRGLTSIVFVQGKDTFGLDYLTHAELDSFKATCTPVSVEYFTDHQILLPDYACSDTLIVMDAPGLNKAMAYIEQGISWGSDADCDSLIHIYCLTFDQYKTELERTGYRSDIALHIALVDFGRIKPDALYTAMMED